MRRCNTGTAWPCTCTAISNLPKRRCARRWTSEPETPDFVLGLTLLYQKLNRWTEALDYAQRLEKLRPHDATYRQLVRKIGNSAPNHAGPSVPQ